ncbi:uncharacterized protein TNCV_2677701 [Trichonephila clavipes]|nr:uncharacterized protein TNCV_2677701 [Trichonephila clavipes]
MEQQSSIMNDLRVLRSVPSSKYLCANKERRKFNDNNLAFDFTWTENDQLSGLCEACLLPLNEAKGKAWECLISSKPVIPDFSCRIWDTENPRTFQEIPLHSPKVTVWCGLTATFILGPFFFEETTRNGPVTCTVTARRYKNMLENFVAPQMLQHQCLDSITFMQDGAPPHNGLCEQQFLRQHFTNDRVISRAFPTAWPPRSPDLNPCDFWLWGYLKYLVYRGRLITLADLKDSITLHARSISVDQLRSAVEQTLHRLQILHLEEGNHIEQHSLHR